MNLFLNLQVVKIGRRLKNETFIKTCDENRKVQNWSFQKIDLWHDSHFSLTFFRKINFFDDSMEKIKTSFFFAHFSQNFLVTKPIIEQKVLGIWLHFARNYRFKQFSA
jgi:hypothetical protein